LFAYIFILLKKKTFCLKYRKMADMIKSFLSTTLDPLLQNTGNYINMPLLYGGLVLYAVVVLLVILPDNTHKNWASTKSILNSLANSVSYLPIAGAIFLPIQQTNYVNFLLIGAGLAYTAQVIGFGVVDGCDSATDSGCTRVQRLGAGTKDFVQLLANGFLAASVVAYVRSVL
jgi:hypothetical protein